MAKIHSIISLNISVLLADFRDVLVCRFWSSLARSVRACRWTRLAGCCSALVVHSTRMVTFCLGITMLHLFVHVVEHFLGRGSHHRDFVTISHFHDFTFHVMLGVLFAFFRAKAGFVQFLRSTSGSVIISSRRQVEFWLNHQ